MRTGAISNAQITASSIWDHSHEAFQGRLNFQAIPMESGSWSAGRNDFNQWLEVFLGGLLMTVTGIATQGRSDHDQWVTKYMLMFSNVGGSFEYFGFVLKVIYAIFTLFSCCCCCLAKQLKYDCIKSLLHNLNPRGSENKLQLVE